MATVEMEAKCRLCGKHPREHLCGEDYDRVMIWAAIGILHLVLDFAIFVLWKTGSL